MLYIIATPIGNLKDITLRALEILKQVDLILAEDTRRTGKLLHHYEIHNKMLSYNDINKKQRTRKIIELLKEGKEIALVSDSGTPGISDPGFYITREAIKNNIEISPIPGPTASIAALICSGLPTDKFMFYGFLPKKEKQKTKVLKNIKQTTIFYESPHRIQKTLKLMNEYIPEKDLVIARELTKKFEEFTRGKVKEVYTTVKDKNLKGELVLIVH